MDRSALAWAYSGPCPNARIPMESTTSWHKSHCFLCLLFKFFGVYIAGAVLAFGAGAIFGWTFGQEIANHWMQLYRMDTMAAQLEFLDWWKKKTEG